jgi:hypothetical protein
VALPYRQDFREYLEILNSRFADETVKNPIYPVDPVRKKIFKKNPFLPTAAKPLNSH